MSECEYDCPEFILLLALVWLKLSEFATGVALGIRLLLILRLDGDAREPRLL